MHCAYRRRVFKKGRNSTKSSFVLFYLTNTFPPIILNAGVPRTKVSRANCKPQPGQIQGSIVKSLEIRSLKHLTNDPFPPFRYLKSWHLHLLQKISTVAVGPFLFGFAI